MDAFGFTKKKLCAQSSENQVKHIINWLSNFYQKLISNRTGPETMDLFFAEYHMVLNWVDILPLHKPKNHDTRLWIEFISDAIHMLRQTQGFSPRDYNLLEDIKTKDLEQDALFNPCIDYHIALDGLRSLFNIGTIFRTCDAAGFSSIILGNCPGSEHPSVQKTAMGAQKWVKALKTCDLAQTLMEKKENGHTIIGCETVEGSTAYDSYLWPPKGVVVFGNEEYGISSHVLSVCDDAVRIPMRGKKNSINVASAVSVIAFHIASCLLK